MRIHPMTRTRAGRALAAAAAGAALAATAGTAAASPAEVPLGQFTCTDGTTITPVGKDVPGFARTSVGFVEGRALAPRWFAGEESGTMTVTSGPHVGDVVTFSVGFSEPANGRPAAAPTLATLMRCSSDPQVDEFSVTLDEGAIAYTGIDPMYLGATADVEASLVFSVFVQPTQLAHR